MTRIAYLGPEGTVSQAATAYMFPADRYELVPFKWISDVCKATVEGNTQLGIIPIENTIDGSVNPHIDYWLNESDLPIQAEWTYPSVQNLIGYRSAEASPVNRTDAVLGGRAGAAPDELAHIRHIISIPVAIAQCQLFLKDRLPGVEFVHVSSTAEGVRLVKERGDRSYAAIGASLAAEKYGLELLATNITDHHNNYTRFIAVGASAPELPETDNHKTTILVTLPEDYPGALHQVLSAFAWRRINLTKIESRPTKKKLGSYYFYIDIEGSMNSVLLPAAIGEIEAIGCQVRILGSYPSYHYEAANTEE